jgi:hypothetical protein
MTTATQVKQAEALAEKLRELPYVGFAKVDDFDDNGSFAIFVGLVSHEAGCGTFRFTAPLHGHISRMKAVVKAMGGRWEWHEAPRPLYDRQYGECFFQGYDTGSYKLSVAFPELYTTPAKPEPRYACFADQIADETTT